LAPQVLMPLITPSVPTYFWQPMADFSCMLRVYFPGYTQPQLTSVIKRDACNVVARVKNMKTRPNHTPRAFDDGGGTHRLHAKTPVLGPASSPEPVPLMVSADLAAAFEEFTCTFVDFFSAVCRDVSGQLGISLLLWSLTVLS
jgi:hypothetical protein